MTEPTLVLMPEECFNLWVLYNEDSHSFEWVAGKQYALSGSKDEMLNTLRQLAASDFFSAYVFKVYGYENVNELMPLTSASEIFDAVWHHLGQASKHIRKSNQDYLPSIRASGLTANPIVELTILIKQFDGKVVIDPSRNIVDLERE